jgi:two-component system, NtrC family, response regulator AtoC
MGSIDQTASRIVRPGGEPLTAATATAYLLVVENNSSSIFHLPRSGDVVIGRTSDATLQLEHPSVSRRHATIRIDNGVMRVADLGSHNKTRVNGEMVQESRTLSSGDVVSVGDVVLVVHVTDPPVVSRATYAEAGWRRRLAEEMDRAVTHHRSLAVIAIEGINAGLVPKLGDTLRLIDVIGEGADGTTLLLLPELDRDEARMIANSAIVAVLEEAPSVRAGLAMCPTDAADADTILLAARKALRSANPGSVGEASGAVSKIELGSRTVMVLDPAMSRVYDLLKRLAGSQLPVLINGETGVGKENAAFAVHHWSERTGEFIAKNCANFTAGMEESELFGHDKGAFTGATSAKPGLFESAAGGTLFLDELGELPLGVQAKLLRALENKTITRLGETRERPIDVRFVAATHHDLDGLVEQNKFRRDLLYRLKGAKVILPPLRERRCEIPMLAQTFLDACKRPGERGKTITPDAMQALLTHHWPGNVRELKNAIERGAALAPDDRIEPSDLPPELFGEILASQTGSFAASAPSALEPGAFRPINEEIRELERRRMAEALAAADGVKTKAAALIEMPIRTFTLKLKQFKL